jgi:hypothetical protein
MFPKYIDQTVEQQVFTECVQLFSPLMYDDQDEVQQYVTTINDTFIAKWVSFYGYSIQLFVTEVIEQLHLSTYTMSDTSKYTRQLQESIDLKKKIEARFDKERIQQTEAKLFLTTTNKRLLQYPHNTAHKKYGVEKKTWKTDAAKTTLYIGTSSIPKSCFFQDELHSFNFTLHNFQGKHGTVYLDQEKDLFLKIYKTADSPHEQSITYHLNKVQIGPKIKRMWKCGEYSFIMTHCWEHLQQIKKQELRMIEQQMIKMHRNGYCHLDIHMDNIICLESKQLPRQITLCDFGNSRKIDNMSRPEFEEMRTHVKQCALYHDIPLSSDRDLDIVDMAIMIDYVCLERMIEHAFGESYKS